MRPKEGDVFQLTVGSGVAHIQYVGKDKMMGYLVLVGPKLNSEQGKIDESVLRDGYFIYYHVFAAEKRKLIRHVGHLPPPHWPKRFRWPGFNRTSVIENWMVDDENGEAQLKHVLTPEEAKLPIRSAWNHEFLVTRIEQDWRPETYLR